MRNLAWLFIAVTGITPFLATTLGYGGTLALMAAAMLGFAAIHGGLRYGGKAIALFLVAAFVVGNLFEDLSITTGFPYGFFEHLPIAGPKILHVPIAVGLTHAAAAYLAWSMGSLLLGGADADRRITGAIAIGLVGAFVVTGWDATGDAAAATITRGWIYPNGGGYFGVPLTNFLGWLLAGFCYTLAGGICLRGATIADQPRSWSLQPPALLLLLAMQPVLGLALPDQLVHDPSGQAWSSRALFETETVAALIGPIFASLLAVLLVLRTPTADATLRAESSQPR
jgi:putative membrane protein